MLIMSLSYYMIKKAMFLGMSINCLAYQGWMPLDYLAIGSNGLGQLLLGFIG